MKKSTSKKEKKYTLLKAGIFFCLFLITLSLMFLYLSHLDHYKNPEIDSKNVVMFGEKQTTDDDQIGNLIEQEVLEEKTELKSDKIPLEQQNTQDIDISIQEPMMAIVIDDMGVNIQRTEDIISIKAPLTSSFLTYGKKLKEMALKAKNQGHEIMLHVPMEPKVKADLAPDTLFVSMEDEKIKESFEQMLQKFDGITIKGINNHMGSLFTESAGKLDVIMKILNQQNMFFLDSKTTPYSVAEDIAEFNDVAYVSRDVFLDNVNIYDDILK